MFVRTQHAFAGVKPKLNPVGYDTGEGGVGAIDRRVRDAGTEPVTDYSWYMECG